ncbi:Golgi mannosyltransferase complex subunit [Microbotryomycetes sp. JL221]|nr:Golgi mannosyltransferase complex subunit [Microbotryomycetes sp. JL221]
MLHPFGAAHPDRPPYVPLAKEDPQAQLYKSEYSTHGSTSPSSSSTTESDPTLRAQAHRRRRRALVALTVAAFGVAVIVFALIGVYFVIAMMLGKIQSLPSYSGAQLRDAGWLRPPLMLDQPFHSKTDTDPQGRLTTYDFTTMSTSALAIANNDEGSKDDLTLQAPTATSALHLLILTPMCNSADQLDMLFRNIDSLTHPKANTSIGFLVSDTHDDTGSRLRQFVDSRLAQYRGITLLQKDFDLKLPSGNARHRLWAQGQRRAIMAKARTTLLMSTLTPDVDWVLWLDVDVAEMSPSLFEDLMLYGNAGVTADAPLHEKAGPREQWADVITPNVFKTKHEGDWMQGYDLNNWAETPASRAKIAKMAEDKLLIEGNRCKSPHTVLDTGRMHLVEERIAPNVTLSRLTASAFHSLRPSGWETSDLYDKRSPAYVGQRVDLDAVGGVATLVRAETHRMGAVFPSWVEGHELETEGFGVLAKKVGARIVGLPNYLVIHANR